jgi:hypothetical protein
MMRLKIVTPKTNATSLKSQVITELPLGGKASTCQMFVVGNKSSHNAIGSWEGTKPACTAF